VKAAKLGKIKLSLCLTKYYAMKAHPVLNYERSHEDVWGSEFIAPRILNLGIR